MKKLITILLIVVRMLIGAGGCAVPLAGYILMGGTTLLAVDSILAGGLDVEPSTEQESEIYPVDNNDGIAIETNLQDIPDMLGDAWLFLAGISLWSVWILLL